MSLVLLEVRGNLVEKRTFQLGPEVGSGREEEDRGIFQQRGRVSVGL